MMLRLAIAVVLSVSASLAAAVSTTRPTSPTTLPFGLGVNVHFTQARPGEMEQLAAAGFTFVRMDFNWQRTEVSRGKYDWSAYEQLLSELDPHGIRAVLILDYVHPLYDNGLSPHTDEARKAFAKWAAAAASHFKGRGVIWEMYNEPNISQFWHPQANVDDYAKLALEVGRAIKAAQPAEIYVGPACSTMDWPFLESCFKAGVLEYFDAVSVHPYRPQPPETVAADYRRLRQLIAQYAPKNKSIPVFSGEWGYSCAQGSAIDAETQGKYLARQWLTNISNDVPLSIWYDWHDDGSDPKENEHHFGTVTNDYQPKPACDAAKQLTTELRGLHFNKRLHRAGGADDDYILLFSGDAGERAKIVAWTTSKDSHEVKLAGETIALDDKPKYVTAKATALLKQVIAWPRVPLEQLVSAPADVGGRHVTRGDHVIPLNVTLPGDSSIRQRGSIVVTNPIVLDMWMPHDMRFDAMWSNPSGEAFDGAVYFNGAANPLQLAAGEISKRVSLDSSPDAAFANATIELRDEKNHVILGPRSRRFVRIPFDKTTYAVRAEGDKKVASKQSIEIGGAPVMLALDYDFDPGWKYVCVSTTDAKINKIEGKPKSLCMWLERDPDGRGGECLARMRFIDSNGQSFQSDGGRLDFKGERAMTFDLTGAHAGGHWGGASDGIVHYPIRLQTLFLLDNASHAKIRGRVTLFGPVLVYED